MGLSRWCASTLSAWAWARCWWDYSAICSPLTMARIHLAWHLPTSRSLVNVGIDPLAAAKLRRPSSTMRIFSSGLCLRRVARRGYRVPSFRRCPGFYLSSSFSHWMNDEPKVSLTLSGQFVQQGLTGNNLGQTIPWFFLLSLAERSH